MDKSSLLLSLCIPTNGIVEWIVPVIESIYIQGVDLELFEVVITDNGGKPDLEEAVKQFNYENFHYYRSSSKGFTNQVDAFEKCSGLFCKMLNHRSKLMPGSINALLDFVKRYMDTKPILYCAEGHAKGGEFIECENTDEFVKNLSYYVSWSAGTGAWREDIKDLRNKTIDNYFPHTLFLFNLREETKYVIWNGKYEIMTSDAGKGGYDVFYAFSVRILDIVTSLRYNGRVKEETFIMLKKELFTFLRTLYINEVILPTKHTFIIQNISKSLEIYYSDNYYKLLIGAWVRSIPIYLKLFINRCFNVRLGFGQG